IEAAQIWRQEVPDAVARAQVVVGGGHCGSRPLDDGEIGADRRDDACRHSDGTEWAEYRVIPKRRSEVATQTNFTESSREAHGGSTIENDRTARAVAAA